MLAPIDATAVFKGGDEELTLRLNFRALAMAKAQGVNLLTGGIADELDLAAALRCLGAEDQPDLTNDKALAFVLSFSGEVSAAIETLIENFGGIVEGNRPAPVKKAAPKRKTAKPGKAS